VCYNGGGTMKDTPEGNTPPPEPTPAPADTSAPIRAEIVTPAPTGRPTSLTPDLAEKVFECLRLGLSYVQTCDAVGVSLASFRRWRKRKPLFRAGVKRAEAEAVALRLAVIQAAAAKSWQAAAWWLERRHPDQWAKVESLRVEARRTFTEDQLKAIGEATHTGGLSRAEREARLREIFNIVDKVVCGEPEPPPVQEIKTLPATRGEKIAELVCLRARAREIAGLPALTEAEAFELAARELDTPPDPPRSGDAPAN